MIGYDNKLYDVYFEIKSKFHDVTETENSVLTLLMHFTEIICWIHLQGNCWEADKLQVNDPLCNNKHDTTYYTHLCMGYTIH